ncbi:MAG: hypothetical protein JSR17_12025 [Proteobacteria bacterium]|nr:hypothetical protein [Pseudomonadota bacterium]
MKRIALFLALGFSTAAIAALPPTAESMRRIKAVMDSHDVYDKLGSVNWIVSVKQTQDGYELASEKCTLQVSVVEAEQSAEPKIIGPRQLQVKVGEMKCK